MVLFFICILILVAVPLNLLGLSGPTGIMFTALNLGQYAFTIGALSLLAFRVVKLRTALASILLMVQSFMVVEMLACSINPTSENVVLVLGDLFLSFGVIVLRWLPTTKSCLLCLWHCRQVPIFHARH